MQYDIRRHEKCRPVTTLYDRAFSTANDHKEYYFLWDIEYIPFVMNNSATASIFSQSRLFKGPLIPASVTLETV